MHFWSAFAATCVWVALMSIDAGAAVETAPANPSLLAAADTTRNRTSAPATEAGDLAVTSDVPWNPPRALSRRHPWEQVLQFPGRIVTVPISALGYTVEHGLFWMEKTSFVTKATFAARDLRGRAGLSVRPASLGDRTGLGGTIRMDTPFFGGALKNRVSTELSGSTRKYSGVVVTVKGEPGLLEYGQEWRPQDRFYGLGIESVRDSVSDYATQSQFARARLRWTWNQEKREEPRAAFAIWAGTRNVVTRNGRGDGTVSYHVRFPDLGAATLDRHVEHFIYGTSLASDWRVGEPHWSQGWRVWLSAERYDRPIHPLALRVGQPRGAQFTRYDVEVETGKSFLRDPRTLRLLVRMTNQEVSSGGDRFLISDLPKLGGREGLSGFEAGRFHDLDLLATKISYIFPLVGRLELDVHTEWGAVHSNVWEDLKFSTLRNSFGVALRGRLKHTPFGSIGVDFSPEKTRLRFSVGRVE
ncbi:MAG TPA: hypothetical protein VEY91_11930 [Candidatus Limnocylindria bacterium]|nr:hypothetical protein [Candidatus Limnocylindria bacterium]